VIVIADAATSGRAARYLLPILHLLVAACPRGVPAPDVGSAVDPCLLDATPPEATADTGTLTIVLDGPVRPPSASRVASRSEAIVYRHLYQPLLRVDCEGRLEPALAQTWSRQADGRTWRVTLRAGASFADGTPVTADDQVAWIAQGLAGDNGFASAGLEAVRVGSGAREVLLTFAQARAELPMMLADPALAPRLVRDDQWPTGAGPYRLTDLAGSSGMLAVPISGAGRSLAFRWAAGGDLRDALHRGADLLLSDDPEARDYAATLAGFTVLPLPWDRVYVIAVPTAPDTLGPALSDQLRSGLARDAVRVDARASSGDYWWAAREGCTASAARAPAPRSRTAPPQIVFRRGDPVAQALAERLVAVAGADASEHTGDVAAARAIVGSKMVVVHGVSDAELTSALQSGADAGYVLSLPRRVYDRCGATLTLHAAVPWLVGTSAQIVPLVETRAYVVMRRGAGRLRLDWDGVPVVSERP